MKTLMAFRSYPEKMARESSSAYLFAPQPTLPFAPAQTNCPDCHVPMPVYKTQSKTVHPLPLGCFTARETLLHCQRCQNDTVYAAEELSRLVPSGGTFGYEVLIFVGKALFLRHRRAEEIGEELRARHVRLNLSEVGYLARKFVVYLALAHRQSAPGFQEAMRAQGGYILHLDGTCEEGGPVLMSSLDSLSEKVCRPTLCRQNNGRPLRCSVPTV